MSFLTDHNLPADWQQMNSDEKARTLGLILKEFVHNNSDFGRVAEEGERIFYFYPTNPIESIGSRPIIIGFYPEDFERYGFRVRVGVLPLKGLPNYDANCYSAKQVIDFIRENYICIQE